MSTKQVTIRNRLGKCNCGCQGRDPWHARTFKRVVTTTSEGVEDGRTHEGFTWLVVARGEAQFPWGVDKVHLQGVRDDETGKITTFGWKRTDAF